ncbi:MAG: hypothetical protein Q7S90_10805 [Rubrivivax sp.]|nr:hypothetical protein [Rubrivivax sp.]
MTVLAPRAARAGCAGAAALLLAACSPALDWRDVRPAGSGVSLLMPCKPAAQERSLPLAGAPVRLSLQACSANGQTWGIAHADVGDPARIGVALTELRASAVANLSGGAAEALPLQVRGATPQPASEHLRFDGRLPDGRPMQVELAVFAQGTRVYQATVLGERLPLEASQTYFGSIRFPP